MDGKCYDGLYYPGQEQILVAYTPPARMSQTALVHELMHTHMFHLGLIDPDHKMSQYWTEVDEINSLLSADGL